MSRYNAPFEIHVHGQVALRPAVAFEQLQDAPLRSSDGYSLNDVAKDLNSKIKAAGDEDFVSKKTEVDRELQNKFELVKLLIATRIQEEENELNLASKSAEKKRLLGFLAQVVLGGITVLTKLNPISVSAHFFLSLPLIAGALTLRSRILSKQTALVGETTRLLLKILVGVGVAVGVGVGDGVGVGVGVAVGVGVTAGFAYVYVRAERIGEHPL